jgi:hypothetical protein
MILELKHEDYQMGKRTLTRSEIQNRKAVFKAPKNKKILSNMDILIPVASISPREFGAKERNVFVFLQGTANPQRN